MERNQSLASLLPCFIFTGAFHSEEASRHPSLISSPASRVPLHSTVYEDYADAGQKYFNGSRFNGLTEVIFARSLTECLDRSCGFPLSQYLRDRSCFCGRNARMSACLALERVSLGQGIQMESLFYRAVLHVILRDHYSSFKSERRVGNVYSKAKSFLDYVRRALRKLELDDSKLSDDDIQGYHDRYKPRMAEMHAFNMLKVTLAPCIEGLILLDRLCYLKEQEDVTFSALVQLFDPLLSPRCYAVIGVKTSTKRKTSC